MASKKKREKQRQIEALREEKIAKEKLLDFDNFKPKNEKQRELYNSLLHTPMVVAYGSAGSGKSFIGVEVALKLLFAKSIKRIYLTTPPIPVGQTMGFNPGTPQEKLSHWLAPVITHICNRIGLPLYRKLLTECKIILSPLETMKGLSCERAFVYLDEAQEATLEQLTMVSTRVGKRSTLFINGDLQQTNSKVKGGGFKIFIDAIRKENADVAVILENSNDFDEIPNWKTIHIPVIEFTDDYCVRSLLCRKMLYIISKIS